MLSRALTLIAGYACLLPALRANAPTVPSPQACPAGVLIANVDLTVHPTDGGEPKPLRSLNVLRAGYVVRYAPNGLPGANQKKAEVALVLAPGGNGKLEVLESRPASKPAEWTVPIRAAIAVLVYGPQGLNEKKINSVVGKDAQLVSQLADYADKTTQTEALLDALMRYDRNSNGGDQLQAALLGFSSRFGAVNTRLDRTKPLDEQAGVLLGTLNPALSSYDPLAPQQTLRLQQSASLAASVAALFFGNTVGLAAGGTSMLLNVRTLMFPNVEFRSSFAQATPGQSLTLCARPEAKSRTKLGYLWATRLPNTDAPEIRLASPAHVAIGVKSKLPIAKETPLLGRAAGWTLVSEGRAIPVVAKASPKELELDLAGFAGPPGAYRLQGRWDWETLPVEGDVHIYALPELRSIQIVGASQDRLIERTGLIPVELEGDDFQFVQRATLRPVSDRRLPAAELALAPAPAGSRLRLATEIDTTNLPAGDYVIALAQAGNVQKDVPIRVLPPNPAITNLPLRSNVGEKIQILELRGTGLNRVERITSENAEVALIRTKNKTALQVRLPESASPGDRLNLALKVEGVEAPIAVSGAIEVVGPRPRIRSVSSSAPENLGVRLKDNEVPAGSFTSFSVAIDPIRSHPFVNLQCAERSVTLESVRLRAGEQNDSVRVQQASAESLFVSLEPSSIGPVGCTVTLTVETETEGKSDPHKLGRVVRLPRIESFELTAERLGEEGYAGLLKGQDLETIEKAGWAENDGLPVRGLPTPIAREGARQLLKIALPWPPPAPRSPVYIWLRGERTGRATEARY